MAWSWPGEMGCVYSNQKGLKILKFEVELFFLNTKHWPDLARLNAIVCDSCFIELELLTVDLNAFRFD